MCGFAGVVSFGETPSPVFRLGEDTGQLLAHRGPDGINYLHHERYSLVHTRLAIIDPDPRANQPMQSACKRYTLLYNGEIYNYRALRDELASIGYRFRTDSDTEVVLHFLMEHGAQAFHRLNGCFALAFIDHEAETVLLARDRMGINPLWYTTEKGQFLFASELKALPLQTKRALHSGVLHSYLEYSYNPSHDSIVDGVFRLPPGCSITYPNEQQPRPWFNLTETYTRSASNYAALPQLRTAMDEAVASRLLADVPVGSFLSGGVDSSIVAALAVQHKPDLNTFSVGFSDQPKFDERGAAELVAKHLNTRHHTFDCTAEVLAEHAHHFLEALDEPFADSSGIAMSFLSSQTKDFVKVALSGDGADELFGGYRKHRAHALASRNGLSRISPIVSAFSQLFKSQTKGGGLAKFADALALSSKERYLFWARFNDRSVVEQLFKHRLSEQSFEKELSQLFNDFAEVDAVLLADQRMVLPYDMLTKVDLMSMRYGLEVRVPFLDPQVLALANAWPAELKYNRKTGKIPLRQAFSDLLPASTFARSKQGFEIPVEWLLTRPLASAVQALKNSELLGAIDLEVSKINAIVMRFQAGDRKNTTLVWTLLVLHHWLKKNHSRLHLNSIKIA